MKQNINIEAEGGELVLRNAHGDVVIIPRNKRREALGYLAKGDHSAIDAIAMELPKASDYAMGGAVYDGGEDPIEGVMGPETTIVGKRPFSVKNFLNRWGKHHAENPSDNFFGALGQGLMAPLQLAQAGATYALTGGKEIEPGAALRGSKFTNFMNKLSNSPTMDPISKAAASALGSETGQNILFDPLNIPITKGVQAFSKTKPLGITEDIGSNLIRNGDVENAIRIPRKVIRGIENVFNKIGMQKTFNRLENIGYELSTLPKKLSPSYQRYAEKELAAANEWQENWYSHPEVIRRIKALEKEENDVSNIRINYINGLNRMAKQDPYNIAKFTQAELDFKFPEIPLITENEWTRVLERIQNKNFEATFQSKEAKLQNLREGFERTMRDSEGISGHFLDMDYAGKRQNLISKYAKDIKSTGIHEGNHGLTDGNVYLPRSIQKELIRIFGDNVGIPVRNAKGEFNSYKEYLQNPTEIYARIAELREYLKLTPDDILTDEMIDSLIKEGKEGKTPVHSVFFNMIQNPQKLKDLFNKLPAVISAPLGTYYLQSQQSKNN